MNHLEKYFIIKLASNVAQQKADFNTGNRAGPGAIGGIQAGISPTLAEGGARSNFGSVLGVQAPRRGAKNYNYGSPALAEAKGHQVGGKPIPIGPTGYRPGANSARPGNPAPAARQTATPQPVNTAGPTPGYLRRQNKLYQDAVMQMRSIDESIAKEKAGDRMFQQYGQGTPAEDREFLRDLMLHNKKWNRNR